MYKELMARFTYTVIIICFILSSAAEGIVYIIIF